MIIFSVIIIISATWYITADTRYLGIGWAGNGLSYISDIYTPNNNVSYEVSFHGVNFTFMHWIYPRDAPTDGPYTAYFLIEFADNTSQVLSILTGSWWSTYGSLTLPLTAEATVGTSPIAGILYHGYLDRPVGWRFFVSIF
jgi:hypothetical protein